MKNPLILADPPKIAGYALHSTRMNLNVDSRQVRPDGQDARTGLSIREVEAKFALAGRLNNDALALTRAKKYDEALAKHEEALKLK